MSVVWVLNLLESTSLVCFSDIIQRRKIRRNGLWENAGRRRIFVAPLKVMNIQYRFTAGRVIRYKKPQASRTDFFICSVNHAAKQQWHDSTSK